MRCIKIAPLFLGVLILSGCAQFKHSSHSPDASEANRQTVLNFYEKGLNQKDASAAMKYLGPEYRQHNPNAADGPEGFRSFITYLKDKFPESHSEIVSSYVDGNYVILHVHAVRVPGTRGNAIVDIFRLEDGKIVEHWDVTQAIPEKTASGNSMF